MERIAKVMNDSCGLAVTNNKGEIPLHVAGNPDTCEVLIFYGGNYNKPDGEGKTLLHTRVKDLSMVAYLLEKGLDMTLMDIRGRMPLHYACMCKVPNLEVIKALATSDIEINLQDEEGNTPLHLLCENNYKEYMVLDEDSNKTTVQAVSPKKGADPILLHLISRGANLNIQNKRAETALHKSLRSRSTVKSNILAEHGADPLLEDAEGVTPRHLNRGWFGKLEKHGTFIKQDDNNNGNSRKDNKGKENLPDWVLQKGTPDSGFEDSGTDSQAVQSQPPPAVHLVRTKTVLTGECCLTLPRGCVVRILHVL